MKTLRSIVKQVGNTVLDYCIKYDGSAYSLEIRSMGDFDGYILVEDISRNLCVAENIAVLFAENLVFPSNVLEVLDDLVGVSEDFTNCY